MTRRRKLALALAVVLAAAGATWLALRPGGPPEPSVVVLGEADEQALRDAFNAHADRTRVLVLVSPT